jgi:hypothetical protein
MPSPETLRTRLRSLYQWEEIAACLEHGDESAMADAIDILQGVILNADMPTMARVFRGVIATLDQMQEQIDREGWTFD